jgi:catechol 2,3-dioxygenase-like lactoylglutathione lyase family enzyme
MTAPNITAVAQIARRVKDIDAALHWYCDVLGLPHLYSFGDMAFYDCAILRLLLCKDEAAESILYFGVFRLLRHPCRAAIALDRLHQCAAYDSPARERRRGMDGLLQGQ